MACEREEERSDSGVLNGFSGSFIPDMKISVENMTILFALPWLGCIDIKSCTAVGGDGEP